MKKPLYPVFLLLGLLLIVSNVFANFIVSPTQGHPNITVTLSDIGDSSSTIGGITFGTVEITAAGHALAAVKGTINSDQVVTNLDGEYKVTFTVPTDSTLVVGRYTIRIGDQTEEFLLTGPAQDTFSGQVGTVLKLTGQYGPTNRTIGTITFGSTAITTANHALIATKGEIDDTNRVKSDNGGAYEVSFEIPDHVNGPVEITFGQSKLAFQVLPSVSLSGPTIVKYGNTITLNGKGFKVLDTLTVTVGDQEIVFPVLEQVN